MPKDRYEDEAYEDEANQDRDLQDGPRGRERVRAEEDARKGGLAVRLGFQPARPGEEDIVRSPVVLFLGGLAVVLALLGAIYGFMIIRESANREYDAAVAEMDQGSYTTAIVMFDGFLSSHSAEHELVPAVKVLRSKCKILQQIDGATPDWAEGLKTTQAFISENRDLTEYDDHKDDIRSYAERICRGSAEQAVAQKRRNLLEISPGLIQVSEQALTIVSRLSPADEKPENLMVDITALKSRAEDLIAEQETFVSRINEINEALEQGRPIDALEARKRLLEQYSKFATDPELVALMQKMLTAEQKLLVVEDIDRDAVNEATVPTPIPSLSLTVRTQARSDAVPTGRLVLAHAKNCLYGIDMATGDPIWRQVVGSDLPFFPMPVSSSVAGLLSFNATLGELMLIEQSTGRIIWRQSIQEAVTARPVVDEGQIYLVTNSQHLYKINLESGKITRRLRFSQPILSAPAMMDGFLIIGGQIAVMYTVDPRSLECLQVSYIGHGVGEIRAPMLPMGQLLLMAENHQSEQCRLRILRWENEQKTLSEVTSKSVTGQVLDPMILRGNQLLVPSTGRNISAFTINDEPENEPIVGIGETQVDGNYSGPIYLDSGPDGQVWMATDSLRKLEVKQRTVSLDPGSTAEGIATQPIQRIGENLYVARRQAFTFAVFISEVDRDSLTGFWRTVIGSRALSVVGRENGTAVSVTETGHVFRLADRELTQTDAGGQRNNFAVEPIVTLKLPEGMSQGLLANVLPGGKTAVAAGGEDPRFWILSPTGQVERQVRVSEALELAPEPLERGFVAAVPGKLRLVGRPSGSSRVQDFVAPVEQGEQVHWRHLVPLGDDQVLALDNQQRMFRIQYRKTPMPHLAAVASLELPTPVDARPAVDQGRMFTADASGQLTVLDGASFETIATAKLDGAATNSVWVVDDLIFVELDAKKLVALKAGQSLAQRWALDLEGQGLSGAPAKIGNQFIIAERSGKVTGVTPDGEVIDSVSFHQPLEGGVVKIGERVFALTVDGTLYRLQTASSAE